MKTGRWDLDEIVNDSDETDTRRAAALLIAWSGFSADLAEIPPLTQEKTAKADAWRYCAERLREVLPELPKMIYEGHQGNVDAQTLKELATKLHAEAVENKAAPHGKADIIRKCAQQLSELGQLIQD